MKIAFGHPWRRGIKRIAQGRFNFVVMGAHRDGGIADLFRTSVLHRCVQMFHAPFLVDSNRPATPYGRVMVGASFARHDMSGPRNRELTR